MRRPALGISSRNRNREFAIVLNMKITPNLIASLTGGTVEGDGETELTGFGKIEEAGEGCVTFIANPKYAHFIHSTRATAVLVSRDFDAGGDVRPILIRVDDPYSAIAELLTEFEKRLKPVPQGIESPCHLGEGFEHGDGLYVGAFAYIGSGVKVGRNVKIYPQSYIGDGCVIGDDTVVRPGVRVYEGCRIGSRCILHSGAVIGADGFGFAPKGEIYEKIPQIGNVVIEDDVAHNVEIGRNNVFAAQTGVAGSTKIGHSNRVGGQCGFAGHIRIGDNNEFGAQTGIPNSVGDGKRLIGYPAVEARQFARTQVYLKRLGELFGKK